MALADQPNTRPGPAETLAEPETGKQNRPRGGRATLKKTIPRRVAPSSGCRRAGPVATGRTSPSSAPSHVGHQS